MDWANKTNIVIQNLRIVIKYFSVINFNLHRVNTRYKGSWYTLSFHYDMKENANYVGIIL